MEDSEAGSHCDLAVKEPLLNPHHKPVKQTCSGFICNSEFIASSELICKCCENISLKKTRS